MSPTDRIASGVAKHLFEGSPPTASTRDLIEEAFRRGYEHGRSVRFPIARPTSLRIDPRLDARHGSS
jgi:hypothetical protein